MPKMSLSITVDERSDLKTTPSDDRDADQTVLVVAQSASPSDARKRRHRHTSSRRRQRSKSTSQSCGSLNSPSDQPLGGDREQSVPNVHFYVPSLPDPLDSAEPRVNLNLSLGSMGTHDYLGSQFGSVSITTGTPKDIDLGGADDGDPTKQQQQGFGASLRFMLTKLSSWRQCHKSSGQHQTASVVHSMGPTPDKAPSMSTSSRILRAFSFVGETNSG